MKYLITALFAAVFAFGAVAAEDAPWKETLGRVTDLTADTGISGFMKNEAPAYITGNFSEAERPDLKKGERANRNGYYDKDGKWHGGYFDEKGAFHAGHKVETLFGMPYGVGQLIMIPLCLVMLYLAIVKGFEPLLLLPIGFGGLLANCPLSGVTAPAMMHSGVISFLESGIPVMSGGIIEPGGFLHYFFSFGIDTGIFPIMIFMGVGAMTDFGPLIANPKSFLLGAAAQLGIFFAFFLALILGMSPEQAASIGIIGGADGPTAILVTSKLAPELLGPIAVAAYSYMALVPVIQPPIMKLLTTKKERQVVMEQLRPVSKTEKIIFPIVVTIVVSLLLPSAATLISMLMLGNLLKESGVTERLSKTVSNELCNIVTIMLGVSVGATATAEIFLQWSTLKIVIMGLCAFAVGTAGGVLLGKLMYIFTKGKVNPLIGSAGVSAVPMAARVSQKVGQAENPKNFLLMHAMGPNVSGVIGSAVAAGVFLSMFLK